MHWWRDLIHFPSHCWSYYDGSPGTWTVRPGTRNIVIRPNKAPPGLYPVHSYLSLVGFGKKSISLSLSPDFRKICTLPHCHCRTCPCHLNSKNCFPLKWKTKSNEPFNEVIKINWEFKTVLYFCEKMLELHLEI